MMAHKIQIEWQHGNQKGKESEIVETFESGSAYKFEKILLKRVAKRFGFTGTVRRLNTNITPA